jgi:aminoglycoside 6'-N-acetyltransferase I
MRHLLWPHEVEMEESADEIYAGRSMVKQVFVHDRGGAGGPALGGFIEIGERAYAEGCETSPVAFIEGWFVDEDLRRSGVGKGLVAAAEVWARSKGYREMGSDLLIDNDESLRAHLALGYHEVERLIAMAKKL